MRRSDREITDINEMINVMSNCDVCRLAFSDGDYPYIVPLNFGMEVCGEKVTLYFHSASEGKKLDLIKRNKSAAFEMDCSHRLVTDEEHGNCTMEYESVMGIGMVEFVPEEQKLDALTCLMKHYRSGDFPFNKGVIPQTAVFKLTVEHMTGKRRMKKR